MAGKSGYKKRKYSKSKRDSKSSKKRKTSKKSNRRSKKSKQGIVSQAKRIGTSAWQSFGICAYKPKYSKYGALVKIIGNELTRFSNSVGQAIPTTGLQSVSVVAYNLTPYEIFTSMYQEAVNQETRNPRIFIRSIQSETNFTNQSNSTCFLEIYDFIAREDNAPNASFTAYNQDPVLTWTNDLNASLVPAITTYGTNFFDSPSCMQLWKITKVNKVRLAAGEVHQHVNNCKPGYVIKRNKQQGFAGASVAGSYGVDGITHYTCVIVRYTATDADDTTVTVSKGKLDWVNVQRVRYKYMADSPGANSIFTNVLTTADTQHVMELDGDDALVITA